MTGTAHMQLACRACGGNLSSTFCNLGSMAVANAYLAPDADLHAEPRFPLRAVVCDACRLVQLDTVVDARAIFSDYAYFSSASASWLAHAGQFCADMTARLALGTDSFVIEVASNDGYLLRNFVAAGIACLGVEPAANVAAVARANGVPTDVAFLGHASALAIVARLGRHADLVIANNVLAHVPDVNDFVAGLAQLIGADGLLSIEAPQLLTLVDGAQFDTIYHEHYAYWSLLAMERLLARHGLDVVDLDILPTHGGSMRVMARAAPAMPSDAVRALRAEERLRGLDDDGFYAGFEQRVQGVLNGFRDWLAEQRATGKRIAAYGAAAKGNTFLNAAGVHAADIIAVADRSPGKLGRLLPGSHIPVISPEALLALEPDCILILPWNIADEIVALLRAAGFRGELLTFVPELKVH